jgi:hypothetical protein
LRGLGCGEELSSLWQAARIQSRLNAAIVFLSISKIVLVLKQLSIYRKCLNKQNTALKKQ